MEFINTNLPDVIELRGVTQKYGDKTILENFDLLIEDQPGMGQFVTIMGESGCGKSTILKYITGLQKPDSGEIKIKGVPISDKTRVGMVFQQYSSFPWRTVLENVAFGLEIAGVSKKEREERAMEIIQMIGLGDHYKKFARIGTLSGGQLQRVAIARSLLANPEIIVMDEPFGALDVKTRLQMQELLMGIWEQIHATVVLVTHDISEAVYLSDDIYIMSANPGRIKEHIKPGFSFPRFDSIKSKGEFRDIIQHIEKLML